MVYNQYIAWKHKREKFSTYAALIFFTDSYKKLEWLRGGDSITHQTMH